MFYAFPFRYGLEQFLKLYLTIIIEFLHLSKSINRNLEGETKYKVALGLSFIIFLAVSVLLIWAVVKGAQNTKKRFTEGKFLIVANGLK